MYEPAWYFLPHSLPAIQYAPVIRESDHSQVEFDVEIVATGMVTIIAVWSELSQFLELQM
jgi:hypothetical protein